MRLPLSLLAIIVMLTLTAPLIAPFDPMSTGAGPSMQSPNSEHLFGTDWLGRDVFSRMLYGGRRTLFVSSLATMISVVSGGIIGLSAGTLGSKADSIITVFINSLLAIPPLVIALITLTLLGQGTVQLALATGIAQIAIFAQMTRSAALAVSSAEFIESARAIGASRLHIIVYYILPNIKPTLLGYGGVIFAYSIINSAALSFLGLGGDTGEPDWGVILAESRMIFRTAPWVAVVSGLIIVITVISVNTIADHMASSERR